MAKAKKKVATEDDKIEANDALLYKLLEVYWMFLDKRGAEEKVYEASMERQLELFYLGEKNLETYDSYKTRVLRTNDRKAWEIQDSGFEFEVVDGEVTCKTIGPDRAREELIKNLLHTMAMCDTKAAWKESIK